MFTHFYYYSSGLMNAQRKDFKFIIFLQQVKIQKCFHIVAFALNLLVSQKCFLDAGIAGVNVDTSDEGWLHH